MGSRYEIWISDDRGERFLETDKFLFMNYARIVNSIDYISIAFPLEFIINEIGNVYFRKDWRLQVFRAPWDNFDLRLERTFFLRRPRIYTRERDGLDIIEYTGQGPNSLLERRRVVGRSGGGYTTKDGRIDDIMKEIVTEQLGGSAVDENEIYDANRDMTLTNQFFIDESTGLGPMTGRSMQGRLVLDTLKELSGQSEKLHFQDQVNRRIFYEVAEGAGDTFRFRTFADQRGRNISESGLVFSMENDNIRSPYYLEDHFEEINFAYIAGKGEGYSRKIQSVRDDNLIKASIWARREAWVDARQTRAYLLQDVGREALAEGAPTKEFYTTYLSTPGGEGLPRSLYGVDWDLGDVITVDYAGQQFLSEIRVVYVSVNSEGDEGVTGKRTTSG